MASGDARYGELDGRAANPAGGAHVYGRRSSLGLTGWYRARPVGVEGRGDMPAKSSQTESRGFTAAERAAMKQRAAELRAEGRQGAKKAAGLHASDRTKVHERNVPADRAHRELKRAGTVNVARRRGRGMVG
jgi:hypothetical protein